METIPVTTRDWLREQLEIDFRVEKHSFSNQDAVYKVQTAHKNFYLKIALNLEAEHENLVRAQPYICVPEVISFGRVHDKDHLLLSELSGKNLAEYVGEWDERTIVREFAQAVRAFHMLDVHTFFPGTVATDFVVLHGDMALPNIISATPGSLGYIDLGQMHAGTPDIDIADALWSLQRNIGPDYGELFLREYGHVEMTDKLDAALKFRYSA